ncbi:MAG: hypothetical protein K8M05_28480 [Deltaproteobacteria bacterium]|nr:hypothetical protein [Kofleriaceae bacterium]
MRLGVVVVLALAVGCGGSQSAPATVAAGPAVEDFGPGLALHEASADKLSLAANRVLAASYQVAPAGEAGTLMTEWAVHDAARWPGAETRVVVELTDQKVIVRVQCRMANGSCARTVPDGVELVALAQRLADGIAGDGSADQVLGKLRGTRDDVCACKDSTCVEEAEQRLMDWAMSHMEKLKDLKPTEAQNEEADRIQDEMQACKERIAPAPRPEPSPSTPVTPLPPGGTGSKACDAYLATFDQVVQKCGEKMGPALEAMIQSRNAQLDAFAEWATLDKKSRKAAVDAAEPGCKAANDALRQAATSMGCAL